MRLRISLACQSSSRMPRLQAHEPSLLQLHDNSCFKRLDLSEAFCNKFLGPVHGLSLP